LIFRWRSTRIKEGSIEHWLAGAGEAIRNSLARLAGRGDAAD
jgi:hypothetical protein